MHDQRFTKVSDILLDTWLSELSEAELKLLLTIIRQTTGWNKDRDRISHSQFKKKTGLSPRSISSAVESLSTRDFIRITDSFGRELTSDQRKYRSDIHYEPTDFAQAKSAIISAKLNNSTMQNLPITIYNTNKQQYTLSRDFKFKKQSDKERIQCIQKRKQGFSCSCFRCS
jgi:phage replication O-like protein O